VNILLAHYDYIRLCTKDVELNMLYYTLLDDDTNVYKFTSRNIIIDGN